jgi:hypothetical protein
MLRFFCRPICLFMAVHTFNFSIDTRDAQPDFVAEDLAFNDIESFYEFALEALAGIDNAVEEHEEHDQAEGGALDFKECYLKPATAFVIKPLGDSIHQRFADFVTTKAPRVLVEIDGPPPRG